MTSLFLAEDEIIPRWYAELQMGQLPMGQWVKWVIGQDPSLFICSVYILKIRL